MLLVRRFVGVEPGEPRLPVRSVLLFPLGVLCGVLRDRLDDVRSKLGEDVVHRHRRQPALRVVVCVVVEGCAAALTTPQQIAGEERPAADKALHFGTLRVEDRTVEDSPNVSVLEDAPRSVVAVVAVGDDGHLRSIIADLVEAVDLLDNRALDHVFIPNLAEVMVMLKGKKEGG